MDVKHVWESYGMNTKFWPANLKGKGHLKDLAVDRSIILKLI
jgi:hypothetical protein